MAPSIPSVEPDYFSAGETTQWSRTFANYPATAGWAVTYYFAGADVFQVAGVASGDGFTFTLGAQDTSGKKPGTYQFRAYAEQNAGATLQRYLLKIGTVQVLPDITAATPGDFQTHEERTLAILVAALEGRLTADIEDYQVAGKSVRKIPVVELRRLKAEYAWAVYRQRHRGQMGAKVAVNFFPPDGTTGAPDPVGLPPWMIGARYGG